MIRIAIVGAGAIARVHIQAFLQFPDRCEIVAICNWHIEKAKLLIEETKICAHAFSSLEEAERYQKIDAVSVCLSPDQHADATIWALNHGMHVLVEKPMANSLEECDRMIAAAESNSCKLAVVCQLRFTTPVQRLKSILNDGCVGTVQHAVVNSLWWRGERYHDAYWRGRWSNEGGGVLTSQAIHHLDLLQYLIGMPQRVFAYMGNVGHKNTECEDIVCATLEYNDKVAQIIASLVAHGENQELYFYTEKACLMLPWKPMANKAMPNGFPKQNVEIEQELCRMYESIPPLRVENHVGQIKNFLDAIEFEIPLMADGIEGRKAIEIITAIYKSASLHKPVHLPISSTDPFYTLEGKIKFLPHYHEKYRSVSNMAQGNITFARENNTQTTMNRNTKAEQI